MKRYLSLSNLLIVPVMIFFGESFCQVPADDNTKKVSLEGTFQREDVVIVNPQDYYSQEFSVKSILLNGQKLDFQDEYEIEIDLEDYNPGDYVRIEVSYVNEVPSFRNPDALKTRSTFLITNYSLGNDALRWETIEESSFEPFYVERFQNGKWVTIGKVMSKGPGEYNDYMIPVNHNQGRNVYRIKQIDMFNIYRYSYPFTHESEWPPVFFYPDSWNNTLILTEKIDYEVFDRSGGLMLKGHNQSIDISSLEPGYYYLCLGDRLEEFIKP